MPRNLHVLAKPFYISPKRVFTTGLAVVHLHKPGRAIRDLGFKNIRPEGAAVQICLDPAEDYNVARRDRLL